MDSPEVEIYIRPNDAPALAIDEGKNIRIHYAGQWVDFREGIVKVTKDEA